MENSQEEERKEKNDEFDRNGSTAAEVNRKKRRFSTTEIKVNDGSLKLAIVAQ